MGDLIYMDPNCTRSVSWSTWLEALLLSELPLHADTLFLPKAVSKVGRLLSGVTPTLDDCDACLLGCTTFLLLQFMHSWLTGDFFGASRYFAHLHDNFLAATHPGFLQGAWPIRDEGVRSWKNLILNEMRRFRKLVGVRFLNGSSHVSPTPVRDQWLFVLLDSHARRQQRQQVGRVSFPEWKWELEAATAVLPSLSVRLPFRVFVYEEKEWHGVPGVAELAPLVKGPAFCNYKQWGMDVGFHDFFRTSPVRTFRPDEADFFFVPSYACCHQIAGIHNFATLDAEYAKLIQKLPFFARTQGADHIFSFHYVDLFPSWRSTISRSIFLTPETEVGFERSRSDFELDPLVRPPFNALKDFSIPPYLDVQDVLAFLRHSKPARDRKHLAVFSGKMWHDVEEAADVRGKLAGLASLPGFFVYVYETVTKKLSPDGMHSLMGDARFCFVPRGRAAWSVRFFEALWAGCVPVLLSDHYELPFEALFDVTQFVIKWPVTRIDESLHHFLANIPLEVVERYMSAARDVRCWFLYPPPDVSWLGSVETRKALEEMEDECPNLSSSRNAYYAVVELLARRVRRSRVAVSSFYMPDLDTGAPATFSQL